MLAQDKLLRLRGFPRKQRGVSAIEFSLVALIFFMLFFGIVELARAMYVINTLQEVTRRAAAMAVNTDFTDGTAMQRVRELAVFRNSPGLLMFGDPVSDEHVKIDYLRIPSNSTVPVSIGAALPDSPQANRVNCAINQNAANCIRLVRVRICLPGGDSESCTPVSYSTLVSFIPFSFTLPRATTVANIETLGMPPGVPCNC
jgi:Flp pilus assembly protein TadG